MGGWNGAICVASRCMLNTGRFLWRAQESENNYADMKANNQFWSLLMENAGYDTYMTGKWHVKMPADSIFQHVRHRITSYNVCYTKLLRGGNLKIVSVPGKATSAILLF